MYFQIKFNINKQRTRERYNLNACNTSSILVIRTVFLIPINFAHEAIQSYGKTKKVKYIFWYLHIYNKNEFKALTCLYNLRTRNRINKINKTWQINGKIRHT